VPPRLIKNSKLTNRQLNRLIGYSALEVPAEGFDETADL
jgi:hypothetical protein